MPQTFFQAPVTPKAAAFIEAYQKRFSVDRMPSPSSAAQCYDAVYLLAAAIEQAKSTDGPKILEALENLQKKVEGVVTIYDHPFDAEDHEAIPGNMIVWGLIKNGLVVPAYPEEFRTKQAARLKAKSSRLHANPVECFPIVIPERRLRRIRGLKGRQLS